MLHHTHLVDELQDAAKALLRRRSKPKLEVQFLGFRKGARDATRPVRSAKGGAFGCRRHNVTIALGLRESRRPDGDFTSSDLAIGSLRGDSEEGARDRDRQDGRGIRALARPRVVTSRSPLNTAGPMGHVMGVVRIVEHDGLGHVSVSARPFELMNDGAEIDLGHLRQAGT